MPLSCNPQRYRPTPVDDSFVWPSGLNDGDDDSWADRLWQDMQRLQRERSTAQQRLAGMRDAAAARAAAQEERRRRAAAAAAESSRILAEEHAKEANWREAMLKEVAEVGLWAFGSIAAVAGCVLAWTLGWGLGDCGDPG